MKQRQRLLICVIVNTLLTVVMGVLVTYLASSTSTYFRFGPSRDLNVISVDIDTWSRWWALVGLITVNRVVNLIVNDIATPIFGFSVFNPDKRVIKGHTSTSLQVQANIMFASNSIRGIFNVVVTVSQIDLALIGVIIEELTSVVTIRYLLKKKIFKPDLDPEAPESDQEDIGL